MSHYKIRPFKRDFHWLALILALAMPSLSIALPNQALMTQSIPSSFADLVEQVRPAVVSIITTKKTKSLLQEFRHRIPKNSPFEEFLPKNKQFDEFFRRFFERESFQMNRDGQPDKSSGLGSGFIFNADGLVVTNHHVIEGADEITVKLHDGTKHVATVIGHDAKTDLALLSITVNQPLPFLTFGNSDKARVGDWVIAVGNPFGFSETFTVGIISARGRDIQSGPYDDFIQIDASINKGNSGGPLLNRQGEVIGINTAIYSPTGGNVGIGFALPSAIAIPVIEQLREHGSVERGWLGVQIQSVTDEIADSLGMDNSEGALVIEILPDTPAEKSDILAGDVIIAVNGKTVKNAKKLSRMIADAKAGDTAQLTVWRHGSRKTISVILGRMSGEETIVTTTQEEQSASDVLGLTLSEMTEQTRQQYQLSNDLEGIVIVDVENNSHAAKTGLQAGDVIMMVNQNPVSRVEDVVREVEKATNAERKRVLLFINSKGTQQFVTVKIE
jgi:serine protease Do